MIPLQLRVNQEDSSAESVESVADQEEDATSREAYNTKHREQMRTNVVQEILKTERIYIKHLKDICDVWNIIFVLQVFFFCFALRTLQHLLLVKI